MATFATDTDLLEYVPDVKKYGIQEFLTEHEKTYDDIIRLLNIKWWPTTRFSQYDVSVLGGSQKLSPSRLNSSQFTRAAVYHVLAYHIYPKLSTFDPDGDASVLTAAIDPSTGVGKGNLTSGTGKYTGVEAFPTFQTSFQLDAKHSIYDFKW